MLVNCTVCHILFIGLVALIDMLKDKIATGNVSYMADTLYYYRRSAHSHNMHNLERAFSLRTNFLACPDFRSILSLIYKAKCLQKSCNVQRSFIISIA